ncbi:MAG: family 10 glycosylhydrolase [Armatimonadia bacterium]|nr:family 10 glycosylhydrolase [Armatimonadia bacterium]
MTVTFRACMALSLALAASGQAVEVLVVESATLKEVAPDAARGLPEYLGAVTAALGAAFVPYEVVDEPVTPEMLATADVVILPYNRFTQGEVAALMAFIDDGGKVISFFVAPDELWAAHELESGGFVEADQLAGWAPTEQAPRGFPERVVQTDWGLIEATPTGQATPTAQWVDETGADTGYTAAFLTPIGAHFTHVLLPEDVASKGRALLSVLEATAPGALDQAAQAATGYAIDISPYPSLDAIIEKIEERGRQEVAAADLARVAQLRARMDTALSSDDPWQVFDHAWEMGEATRTLYAYTLPSPECEARAVWAFWDGIDGWPSTARYLRESGFNLVLMWAASAGRAYYHSDVLPLDESVAEEGDRLAQAVEACHAEGLRIHGWRPNWRVTGGPDWWHQQLREEGRMQVTSAGEVDSTWLCPTHPDNIALEVDAMCEMAEKYDVDGVHFDYIRYEWTNRCFCERCQALFEEASGHHDLDWPADIDEDGPIRQAWLAWRRDNITNVVRQVSERLDRTRPDAVVSAAVFQNWESHRDSFGQDWVRWIREGILDVALPMTYQNYERWFRRYTNRQVGWVGGEGPLVSGLGPGGTGTPYPDSHRLLRQIEAAREAGADGWCLFVLNDDLVARFVPDLAKGATAEPAYLPWLAPEAEFAVTSPEDGFDDRAGPVPTSRAGDMLGFTATITTDAPFVEGEVVSVEGFWALESRSGEHVYTLGTFDTDAERTLEAYFRPSAGVWRTALHGIMTLADGSQRPFTVRGPLLQTVYQWGTDLDW